MLADRADEIVEVENPGEIGIVKWSFVESFADHRTASNQLLWVQFKIFFRAPKAQASLRYTTGEWGIG